MAYCSIPTTLCTSKLFPAVIPTGNGKDLSLCVDKHHSQESVIRTRARTRKRRKFCPPPRQLRQNKQSRILRCGIAVVFGYTEMNTIKHTTYIFLDHSYVFRLPQLSHHQEDEMGKTCNTQDKCASFR